MARRSDRQLKRMGAVCLLVLAVAMAAAFNLQKFPGFRGTHYTAEFKDAPASRSATSSRSPGSASAGSTS